MKVLASLSGINQQRGNILDFRGEKKKKKQVKRETEHHTQPSDNFHSCYRNISCDRLKFNHYKHLNHR